MNNNSHFANANHEVPNREQMNEKLCGDFVVSVFIHLNY